MSKKGYSEQEREQVRRDLLSVGLKMLSQHGINGTKLQDILKAVGISKAFFYNNYYTSLSDLVIHVISCEIELLLQKAKDIASQENVTIEEIIYQFLDLAINSRQNNFFVMTQEEEMWVYQHLSPDDFDTFHQGEVVFYTQLLACWYIPQEKCTPKELGNLILSNVIIYNSATRSLPFFFSEELERTAKAQATALSRYLASLSLYKRLT